MQIFRLDGSMTEALDGRGALPRRSSPRECHECLRRACRTARRGADCRARSATRRHRVHSRAAGGPKGLALLAFDRLLHREWLPSAPAVQLIGASIGAWRMAALAQPDAPAALDRLQHAYIYGQRYSSPPSPLEVAAKCRAIVAA